MPRLLNFINEQVTEKRSVHSSSVDSILGTLAESTIPTELPIEARESIWLTMSDPERLVREFDFSDFESFYYFLSELLRYQEEKGHHADISISHRKIQVSTYTRDVDGVTELDIDLANFCDEIYNDIYHIEIARQRANERSAVDFG